MAGQRYPQNSSREKAGDYGNIQHWRLGRSAHLQRTQKEGTKRDAEFAQHEGHSGAGNSEQGRQDEVKNHGADGTDQWGN